MEKNEVKKLISKIKAYYYYFALEKDSMQEWFDKLENYDFVDVSKKVEEHLKSEEAKEPPKLHYLTKNILTTKQKEQAKNGYLVECNLCHRWMPIEEYDNHYDRCLSIEYLIKIAKTKNENIKREDLENCREDVLNRLYNKYKPQNMALEPQKDESSVNLQGILQNALESQING